MFKKDDKVKVVKGIKAFEGLTGTVLDTNGNQVKVKLNLSNDSELQKNLINVFEAYQLELESLDLLKEDTVSFDNDIETNNINENVMWTMQCEEQSALGVAEAKNALLCTENGDTGIQPYEAYSVDYDKNVAYVTYIPKDKANLDNAEDYVIVTEFTVDEFFDYGKWYRENHNMDEDFVFVDADGKTYKNNNAQKAVDNSTKNNKKICCICGKEYTGYGNNAEPYKQGRCCDDCNEKFVIPDRINRMKKNDLDEEKRTKTITFERVYYLVNAVDGRFLSDKEEVEQTDNQKEALVFNTKREAIKALNYVYNRIPNLLFPFDEGDEPEFEIWYQDKSADYNDEGHVEFKDELKPLGESLKLTEEELKAWCSDNDANYYTQDIKDDKVIIRGLNEDLAEYDFKTKELKVFDYSGTTVDENELDAVEDDDNYIRDYVYDIDMMDEKTEIPSWEFASIIATAEDTTEDAVVTEAHDRGFKVYLITASNYEKLVIASEKITEDDIMEDFASYLEGSPKVTEVI